MSCAFSFLSCLKFRRGAQHQTAAPLLATDDIEDQEGAANPIDVSGGGGGVSGEGSIEEISALEQQQRAALLTRKDGAEPGTASQVGMPEPSAPPAPEVPVNPTSPAVQEALVNTVDAGASEENQEAALAARGSTGGAGASLRSSELPPAPPLALARVDAFRNRAGARLAGVFAPRGERPDTPTYRPGVGAEQAEATA